MNAKKIIAIAGLSLAGLTLTACGGGVEKNAEYESVIDLREAIVSADVVDCPETQVNYDAGGLESVGCGREAVLVVWPKESVVASSLADSITESSGYGSVRGPNWMVVSPDVVILSNAKADLGGTMSVNLDEES